jgi:hypothetical protein
MTTRQTGLTQRTTAVSNTKKAVFAAVTNRVVNPHEVTIVNTDTIPHIVDFFNTTAGTTIIFTMVVPSDERVGGEADYYEDNEISSWTQNLTAGSALAAASRDAVGGAGLEIIVRAGRL